MQLARGEVHVWSVPLDVSPETSAGLYETLGEDEQSRSARFRFERDRRRFIVARGSLRELLTRYLATPPGQLRFVYNTFGKPGLSPECGSALRFNISHSADLALIAIALDAEVGVDLEHLQALPDYAEIARGFFSPAEVDELTRLPSGVQAQAFSVVGQRKRPTRRPVVRVSPQTARLQLDVGRYTLSNPLQATWRRWLLKE